ncbi:MAG TPA: acriflavin resistance protein [Lachnospiraceae bacterium]|nr:acriflavin resistance protein [Lachnospiraceae bacterium]
MISKFSVKKPYTVLVGVVLAIILGVVSFSRMTTDLLPNISLPYVIVMTTYPGASPETVEMAVTQPVEASMATVSNIESISSVSNENYSMVILEFAQTADMNAVSLEIRESLDQISSYWDDSIGNPIIMKLNPDMLPVMVAAVGVDGMDNGQISTYVQESIIPELESIEGVASVNATGLLEESVNVIIRQDKVDAVNEKVFVAIDEKMKETEEDLEEGRKSLEDGRAELENSKAEIRKGRKELADGKAELENGKNELNQKKDETSETLANTKKDLLTAKADLEAAKMNLTTNLATARQLSQGIAQVNALADIVTNTPERYQNACQALYANIFSETPNPEEDARLRQEIGELKAAYLGSGILSQMKGRDEQMDAMIAQVEEADWADSANAATVGTVLAMVSQGASGEMAAQREKLEDALNAQTSGMGLEGYEAMANQTLATLEEQLSQVNAGLVAVEKGQLEAALGFAEGSSQIALGDYQMKTVESQLDAAEEQIKNGEEQLKDAEEQLEEGEKQLADAKEAAYEQADMTNVLTVDTVKNLLSAQNFSMPAGYVTEEGISYMVRVGDKPSTVDELKEIPLMDLHMDGVPVVKLGDVADVFYTDNSDDIYATVDGSAGILLTIQKQTGYSTGEVSDLLGERFEELMTENADLSLITLMDQGIYIDLVMDSIINNILFGAVLAILILLVFLKDLRPTLVVAFSIPVSLVTAIVCMYFSGVTLNIISLSGLALGIGMLVDNSIVVIENIYRLRSEGYSVREAAMAGASEVAGAIMASTLTTVCVFLPIVFTEGITRQLFVDMGLTIAYSLLASLVIALTVVPAMSSRMLVKTKEQKESRFFGALVRGYEKLLSFSLKVKPLVIVIVLVLLAGSMALAFQNGIAFMADMDSPQLTVNVQLAEEATLQDTRELTDQVVESILSIEDVQNVGAMASSSTMSLLGGGGGSTNAATIYVVAKDDKSMSNEEIGALIKEKTAGLDAEITVDTSSMDMSAMGGSGISIQVRGRELDTLRRIAEEVAAIVESVEGTADVNDGLEDADEELRIIINRDEAVHYGLTVAQVYTQLYAKLAEAASATTLVSADKDYNVYVMSGNDIELTRELVKGLELDGTDENRESVKVPLSKIAEFETTEALSSIRRADQTRYISVSAAIAEGYNVGQVASDVENKLNNYEMPAGYRLVYSGENETIMDAMEQIMLMLVLAVLFMYLIMVAQFQSLLSPFIIMFTIPLAFTGGFMGLYISGSEVSVIAMIGFVMLAGIIVNNGIVIIDYMNQLRENGCEKRQAILTAGRTRLRPVLMTALTTILALSTMVFSNDMGAEMAKPMAVVTIGGLTYGTLLTLIVIPCIYDMFIRDKKRRQLTATGCEVPQLEETEQKQADLPDMLQERQSLSETMQEASELSGTEQRMPGQPDGEQEESGLTEEGQISRKRGRRRQK